MPDTKQTFVLPLTVVGPADINNLQLELEALADYLRQQAQTGQTVQLPKLSRMLENLAEQNNADLVSSDDRDRLEVFLETMRERAPSIHISFASEPSAAFIQKILVWLRGNISSFLLLQVGLQPTIAAGCVVRTTNKVFDMSLRQYLDSSSHLLSKALSDLRVEEANTPRPQATPMARPVPAPAPVAAAPVNAIPAVPAGTAPAAAKPQGAAR